MRNSPPAAAENSGAHRDIFLKIDGIVGEAQHVKHKNEIAVESYSWSESAAPFPGGATGLSVGRVQMQGFSVSMKASKASLGRTTSSSTRSPWLSQKSR